MSTAAAKPVWDRFSHAPGNVKGAYTGDVACDDYHRYPEDIALMKQMNMRSYRYSIAWSRIQPTGEGAVNQKGIDYYKRLTDAVLAAGMRPLVTLYHWDLPQPLEDKGGWPNRDTAARFADYTEIAVKALGDRIQHMGHLQRALGLHLPRLRKRRPRPRKTGLRPLPQSLPHRKPRSGRRLPRHQSHRPEIKVGQCLQHVFHDARQPLRRKTQPQPNASTPSTTSGSSRPPYAATIPKPSSTAFPLETMGFQSGDDKRMTAPLDYIGVNYYFRQIVANLATPAPTKALLRRDGLQAHYNGKEGPLTDFGWEVYPRGMYEIVQRVSKDYKLPIEITENGCSYGDYPDASGRVADVRRIHYYREHLRELARAIQDGADVRGYHSWSILDNFEWSEGYTQRFGMVFVDFPTQRRFMKDSAKVVRRASPPRTPLKPPLQQRNQPTSEAQRVSDNTSVPPSDLSPSEEYKQRQQAREQHVAHFAKLHRRFGNLRLLIVTATLIAAWFSLRNDAFSPMVATNAAPRYSLR